MTEEQILLAYSKNNPIEYATKAAQANKENKKLKVLDGILCLVDFELSLEEVKKNKIEEINTIYENKAKLVKVDTPESEILTWDIQKTEAEGVKSDSNYPTPFIDGLAQARQVEKSELINKVLAKVTAFNAYMAMLTGQRQYFEDRVKEAETISMVNNIVWE